MQSHGAIRFSWAYAYLFISRPRSCYDWIQLESIIKELIYQLESRGFTTEAKKIDKNTFLQQGK